MGNILKYPAPETVKDFYPPVEAYDPKKCVLLHYSEMSGVIGLMVAYTSEVTVGVHAVETPDTEGWVIRHISKSGDSLILVDPANQVRRTYPANEVKIIGRVVQFICDWDTGERWELIHGPAVSKRIFPRKVEQTATLI